MTMSPGKKGGGGEAYGQDGFRRLEKASIEKKSTSR
jgi:hypothetical protein